MMTPTEKFILSTVFCPVSFGRPLTTHPDSFLFLTLSMVLIAASLYLPEHIVTISHRAFYYYSGRGTPPSKASAISAAAAAAAAAALTTSAQVLVETATAVSV